ncbi:MAG: potassium channel family protein [Actinomycetota bacterium]|nr:potassium channel family protein [Actinomycetota bacterium]
MLEIARGDLTTADRRILDIANVIVFLAFAIDYAVELSLSSDRRAFVRAEWLNGIIVLASAIAVVPVLAPIGGLRILRGVPAVRGVAGVVRILAIGGAAARDVRQLVRRRAVTFACATAALTWLSAAAAFTLAEDVGADGRLRSFTDALWWSAATITTVGYGDVAPTTVGGRLAGVVTMIVGISTFAVITARVAAFLVVDDDA